MKISRVNVYKIKLPFSVEFSHSLRRRFSVNNIVVELICDNGEIIGYGEGAPRSYVTGETQESAYENTRNMVRNGDFPWKLNNIDQLWNYIDSLPDGKKNNSSICAMEMAFLDAFAKNQRKSILKYFSHDYYISSICYGAAIPLGSEKVVAKACEIIKNIGTKKIKLKMGNDPEQNQTSLKTISKILGNDYDLKVDVNGVWSYEMSVYHLPILKDYNVKVLEQPMSPDDPKIEKFAEDSQKAGIILMADESVCSLDDMNVIKNKPPYKMINIRVSKCGGLRRSLKLIEYLRNENYLFQIGCQLGESGLLSAAGRALSLLCRDAVYYDGSYDKLLLKENITKEDVTFGPMGKAGPLEGYGLGVTVDIEKLIRLGK